MGLKMWMSNTFEHDGGTGIRPAARTFCVVFGVAAAVLLVVTASLQASDPPHWLGAVETTDCTSNCHTLHHAQGGQLTAADGNVNLCQSCHNSNSLPITNTDKASPGLTGRSHAFDVAAEHATYGTQTPQTQAMFLRIMDGNVVCSTCHNQHAAEAVNGGTPRIGDTSIVVDQGGTGTLTSGGEFSGVVGLWYLIDITVQGSDTTARFRYSKDNGTSWTPTDCSAAAPATCLTADTTPVALDDGVEVTFAGAAADDYQLGERWEFYASYPFLRIPLDQGDINSVDKFCRDCHSDWVMTHNSDLVAGGGVESWDGNFKSHPVGVGLGANGAAYDRAPPLDGNGLAQASISSPDVDGNPSNDLKLDAAGNVQCLSCHGVHYADSNTLTVDGP
jgi:predicted CXXCH cytochrome family protein